MRDIMANLSSISASAAARVSRPREGRPLKESTATEGEVEEGYEGSTLMEKTQEFFQLCDIQQKGFITRRDMQVSLCVCACVVFVSVCVCERESSNLFPVILLTCQRLQNQ